MPYADKEKARVRNKVYNASPRARAKRAAHKKAAFERSPFVGIDSEGHSFGPRIERDGRTFQAHKTFLWGAGDKDGNTTWLSPGRSCKSEEICDFLLTLPKLFGPSIFVSFAFSYDATQILSFLPYEKAYELQRGKPFGDDKARKNNNRIVFYKNYGFQYLPGKKFTLYKFDPLRGPYKDTSRGPKLNYISKILIYDVFGFFQSSFIKAALSMPGAVTPDELTLIERGKKGRETFDLSDIEFIKSYTTAELTVLSRMMTLLRHAMDGQRINLRNWFGAGSIAQALLKRENVKQHFPEIRAKDLSIEQERAHYAYFGGRIELCKQGFTSNTLYGYDIASAYPHVCTQLPSMAGGTWQTIKSPSRDDIERSSLVSIVHIQTRDFPDAPFYPLPYRMPTGAILFPRSVHGFYMRDEALAALDWAAKYDCSHKIELKELNRFIPVSDVYPFSFLADLFKFRKSLPKGDITQLVIKLGINSCYGKLAQGVSSGAAGKVPGFANPFYAAAITAGTRARLLVAALDKPDAIVMLATDGILATKKLGFHPPKASTLGAWEYGENSGGIFVQSGVYALQTEKGWQSKTRGFRPSNIDGSMAEFLTQKIPQAWAERRNEYRFPYVQYMTLGASVASRDLWEFCGQWASGTRDLDLEGCGVKRQKIAVDRPGRAKRLVASVPSNFNFLLVDEAGDMLLSAPFSPDWLDPEYAELTRDADEQETIASRFS
jgi:hypothetical protein